MNKLIYLISGVLGLTASIICSFFDWRISLGVIIGVIFSFIYFLSLNKTFKINDDGSFNKGGILLSILRIVIIAIPLVISVLFPNYFNIFGAFGGVMLFRLVMIYFFFKQQKGGI